MEMQAQLDDNTIIVRIPVPEGLTKDTLGVHAARLAMELQADIKRQLKLALSAQLQEASARKVRNRKISTVVNLALEGDIERFYC